MSCDSELLEFESVFTAALNSPPTSSYKISGVAKVLSLNNVKTFSASLYEPRGPVVPGSLAEYVRLFQPLVVNGFKYSKTEVLVFKSSLSLPGPKWRVQVVYVKV